MKIEINLDKFDTIVLIVIAVCAFAVGGFSIYRDSEIRKMLASAAKVEATGVVDAIRRKK